MLWALRGDAQLRAEYPSPSTGWWGSPDAACSSPRVTTLRRGDAGFVGCAATLSGGSSGAIGDRRAYPRVRARRSHRSAGVRDWALPWVIGWRQVARAGHPRGRRKKRLPRLPLALEAQDGQAGRRLAIEGGLDGITGRNAFVRPKPPAAIRGVTEVLSVAPGASEPGIRRAAHHAPPRVRASASGGNGGGSSPPGSRLGEPRDAGRRVERLPGLWACRRVT